MSKKNNLSYPYSQSISYQLNPINPSSTNRSFISEIYYNPKLEQKIASTKPNSSVDLSYWNLIDQDIPLISKQILLNKQCTELNLCGNKITSQGVLILSLKLSNNTTLKTLDLSYNLLTDGGIHCLSQILLSNSYSSLKILFLNKNAISNDGVKYLVEMLQMNQTLTDLSLSDNEIGNNGVKDLANVLIYQNRTLKVLILSFNLFITDLCIEQLVRMIEYNQILEKLIINNCNLTEIGKMKLREKVNRKNNKFQLIV